MTKNNELYKTVLADAHYIGYEKPNELTMSHIITIYDKDKEPLRIYPLTDEELVENLLKHATATIVLEDGTFKLTKARKGIATVNTSLINR